MQTGSLEHGKFVGEPSNGTAPIFLEKMQGKIADPVARKAFDYWVAVTSVDKWLGLPVGTPDDILAVYREAFRKLAADKEFLDLGRQLSGEEFGVTDASRVESFVATLADTTPEALEYIKVLMRKQGMSTK